MLRELTIRNVAVIDALTVPFMPGLNVLTGETGAGKSILIDALQLVLGARSSEDLLRSEATEAMVEAAFDPPLRPEALAPLAAEGIVVEPGEFLVLRRHLSRDGRSRAYVNGRLTSAGTLSMSPTARGTSFGEHFGDTSGAPGGGSSSDLAAGFTAAPIFDAIQPAESTAARTAPSFRPPMPT